MKKIEVLRSKITNSEEICRTLEQLRLKSKKIVFTNGCFDLLHPGHIDYLCKAADLGDILIVGVNSDESVKHLGKGANRPIQDQGSRSLILAALHMVDYVIIFDEDTPYELIKTVNPDFLVKGADYTIEEVAGHDLVMAAGGQVVLVELLAGFSTTGIENKIRGLHR